MSLTPSDLYNSVTWSDPDAVHGLFAEMRRTSPVHFCAHEGYPDLWHITKHADIFEIERNTSNFLSAPRLVISSLESENTIRAMNGGSLVLIKSLVAMDAPEHPKTRILTQAWFMPKNLARVQDRIDRSAETALARMREKGGHCDFARDVALEFPMRVIMEILGVPAEDYPRMLALTQNLFGPDDPDTNLTELPEGTDPTMAGIQTYMEYCAYFDSIIEDRKQNPRDDLASLIANAEIDGEPIDHASALGYFFIVATAGHDTTSFSLSEAVHQLARDPALFARLKADPDTMAPKIVEEAIRYASSVRHFVRTAKEDYDLRGQTIKAGQSVILWYPSGSRDEDVFVDSDTFNADRDQSTRHAAFGHAAHMCLGMHLARQENVTFLKKLASQTDGLELSDKPAYVHSSFVGGIKKMPLNATLGG